MSYSRRLRFLLAVCFLLFAATIFGAVLVRGAGINTVALAVLLVASTAPFLFSESRVGRASAIVIWVVGFALLFNTGRIPPITSGEKVVYAFPLIQNFWDPSLEIYAHLHSRTKPLSLYLPISLQMIIPEVTGLPLETVFLIVFPLLFSIVPVILFKTYQQFLPRNEAGMGALFFISYFGFYFTGGNFDTGGIMRTGLAIIFLSIFGYLMLGDFTSLRSRLLGIVFIFSISMSHYGVAYLLLPLVVGGFLARLGLSVLRTIFDSERRLRTTLDRVDASPVSYIVLVILVPVIVLSWYTFTAKSINLVVLADNAARIFLSLIDLFGNSYYEQSNRQQFTLSILWTKRMTMVFSGLMAIGVARSALAYISTGRSRVPLPWISIGIASVCLGVLPLLSQIGFPARFYTILFVFLAPFTAIGMQNLLNAIGHLMNFRISAQNIQRVFAVSLVIFLLLSHGFISEAVTDGLSPVNRAISMDRIESDGDEWQQWNLHRRVIETETVQSVDWISKNKAAGSIYRGSLTHGAMRKVTSFKEAYARGEVSLNNSLLIQKDFHPKNGDYVLLTHPNVKHKFIVLPRSPGSEAKRVNVSDYGFDRDNRIYSNGEAIAYFI